MPNAILIMKREKKPVSSKYIGYTLSKIIKLHETSVESKYFILHGISTNHYKRINVIPIEKITKIKIYIEEVCFICALYNVTRLETTK